MEKLLKKITLDSLKAQYSALYYTVLLNATATFF